MRDLMAVAQLRPVEGVYTDVPRGLKGVVVTETELGDVRGLEGFYHYRQYSAVELAERRTLEDVWQLLLDGRLPGRAERAGFAGEVAPLRTLPACRRGDVAGPRRHDAGTVRSTACGRRCPPSPGPKASGPATTSTGPRCATTRCGWRAVTPTVVAALHRLGQGLEPIEPDPQLGHAANYLWMVSGQVPDPAVARAIEQYLMLTVDHGFNASTFTARVVASTGADLGAAVVGRRGRAVRTAARRRPKPGPRNPRGHRQPGTGRGVDPRRGTAR